MQGEREQIKNISSWNWHTETPSARLSVILPVLEAPQDAWKNVRSCRSPVLSASRARPRSGPVGVHGLRARESLREVARGEQQQNIKQVA